MNRNNYWKQFEGAPQIECLKMKRDIQTKIYEEIKGLTMDEQIDYFRRGSEEFRRQMAQCTGLADSLVLREEPPQSGET